MRYININKLIVLLKQIYDDDDIDELGGRHYSGIKWVIEQLQDRDSLFYQLYERRFRITHL